MARKSDTQELAKKTADILLQEGIRPTQQNVRERMGYDNQQSAKRLVARARGAAKGQH